MAAARRERRLRPCRSSISRFPTWRSHRRRRRGRFVDVAADLGLEEDELELVRRDKAKIPLSAIERRQDVQPGKLIAVTGITPTPAGEGKTTTAIGLADALALAGRSAVVCLREPSMGPVFGIKGAARAAAGRRSCRWTTSNLHFTGDIHAVTSATNLLAALLDAHLFHGNELGIDAGTITWRRCLDVNERSLRSGFDITAASETMAILAAARDLADLRVRLGRITVARRFDGSPVTAEDLEPRGQ